MGPLVLVVAVVAGPLASLDGNVANALHLSIAVFRNHVFVPI